MEIRCIITDVEPLARKGLRGYIEKIDFLSLTGECEDALQLTAMIRDHPADLIFLDIEMPEVTGIDWLNTIKDPPKVVIVSAYEQYALKGYEYNVVDYLLKPVSFDRFLKSVNKIHHIFEQEQRTDEKNYFFVKSGKQLKKINTQELLFMESMENYVIIHTLSTREIIYTTLKQMLNSLPEKLFLQVHRSFVVNIQHIRSVEGNQLFVGKNQIPISRSCKEKVIKEISKYQ